MDTDRMPPQKALNVIQTEILYALWEYGQPHGDKDDAREPLSSREITELINVKLTSAPQGAKNSYSPVWVSKNCQELAKRYPPLLKSKKSPHKRQGAGSGDAPDVFLINVETVVTWPV